MQKVGTKARNLKTASRRSTSSERNSNRLSENQFTHSKAVFWLWRKISWWLGPLLAVGAVYGAYFAGLTVHIDRSSNALIDRSLIVDEALKLSFLLALVAVFVRFFAMYSSLMGWTSGETREKNRELFGKILLGCFISAAVVIFLSKMLLGFGGTVSFLFFGSTACGAIYIILLFYGLRITEFQDLFPDGVEAGRASPEWDLSEEPSKSGKWGAFRGILRGSMLLVKALTVRMLESKALPNAVLTAILLLSVSLGQARTSSLAGGEAVRITLSHQSSSQNYIDGTLFGKTENGVLLIERVDPGSGALSRVARKLTDAHYSLKLVSNSAIATIERAPKNQ